MERIAWTDYFMGITKLVAGRSSCTRRQVGAIAVKDTRILATGYNGAPTNVRHCLDIGCLREKSNIPSGERHEMCRGLHAEQNVIIQAATHGVSLAGATFFITHKPCSICSKMIINCGIIDIYFASSYPDAMASEMLAEAGINLIHYEGTL